MVSDFMVDYVQRSAKMYDYEVSALRKRVSETQKEVMKRGKAIKARDTQLRNYQSSLRLKELRSLNRSGNANRVDL